MDDLDEKEPSGFFLNTAVLHILDCSSGITEYSQISLNLDDDVIDSYVTKQVRRAMNDIRCRKGYFAEDSIFLAKLKKYIDREINFVDFTIEAAEPIERFLKERVLRSYDVLFADWSINAVPYTGFLMLENQQSYIHQTSQENGILSNSIIKNHAIMPSPSKKVNSFAIINRITMEISYVDTTDWNQGDARFLQDEILNCTSEPSRQEILETVTSIAGDIAVQYDENPTLLLSKFKNYVRSSTEEDLPLTTEDLAIHVFNDSEEMQNAFISKSVENELPAKIDLPHAAASRSMKNQKIRTDTGIELTFPTEYFENPDLIEFVTHEDGRISIEIKNVGKIINK